jgi:hypothetical protein
LKTAFPTNAKWQFIHNQQLGDSRTHRRIVYQTSFIPRPEKCKPFMQPFILNATGLKSFAAGSFIEAPDRLLKSRLGQTPAATAAKIGLIPGRKTEGKWLSYRDHLPGRRQNAYRNCGKVREWNEKQKARETTSAPSTGWFNNGLK